MLDALLPPRHGSSMSALAELRRVTAPDHEGVDAAFGRFDLTKAAGYTGFLSAHARALPAVEGALAGIAGLPPLRPRTPLIAADLAALDLEMPAPLAIDPPADAASAFGMAYVIEGSRLGGGMLAKRVPPGMPSAYLSATHLPGEWRAFGQALDAAAGDDPAWIVRAVAAANGVFNLYREAATA
jgi:heme oxygenase